MRSHQMHMKVCFEQRNYLLNRFPESFTDLMTQIEDKVKRPLSREVECFFVDKDGDRIMVAEDADLLNVREVCRLEGKDVCKLIVELPENGKRKAESSPTHSQHCVDGGRYLTFLKKTLPTIQEDFASCFSQGMPCEECFGVGKTRDMAKCENCYGRGVRPLTKQMKMIMQYIDLRFQQLLLAPLETFMASENMDPDRLVRARDSSSSLEENLSKADNKKTQRIEHSSGGFFGREPLPSESGQRSPRKLSHRDDFNKIPNDD
jgi:hypothetical protein